MWHLVIGANLSRKPILCQRVLDHHPSGTVTSIALPDGLSAIREAGTLQTEVKPHTT